MSILPLLGLRMSILPKTINKSSCPALRLWADNIPTRYRNFTGKVSEAQTACSGSELRRVTLALLRWCLCPLDLLTLPALLKQCLNQPRRLTWQAFESLHRMEMLCYWTSSYVANLTTCWYCSRFSPWVSISEEQTCPDSHLHFRSCVFLLSNTIMKTKHVTESLPSCRALLSYLFYFWSFPPHDYLFWLVRSLQVTGRWIVMLLPPDKAGTDIDGVEKKPINSHF